MLAAEGIMPMQPDGTPSPIVISSSASQVTPASSIPGPPEISPTQPFSPERGQLTPGREHALGEG
eukprot:2374215-Alexandrium_andersonii.AAC.1